ncbi:MAG: amidohydrolase family protein [Actinomycetota bacterium]|nr:amidohydrolase family protein [Actinomycetota bacterium]
MLRAAGKAVCPGFVNIHSHDDLYIIRPDYEDVFEPYLRQGITTTVISNCGWSPSPWIGERNGGLLHSALSTLGVSGKLEPQWETQADFHHYLEARPLPVNLMPLAAHGPIRIAAMGEESRFSTRRELEEMKNLIRVAMEAGCRGFSTGLTYFPGVYAHTDEIVELAGVVAEYGGRYVTHVRGHCSTYDRAVEEEGSVTFLFGMTPRRWSEKVFTLIQDHSQLFVGSDTLWPEAGDPPSSGYVCFSRILGYYVRELCLVYPGGGDMAVRRPLRFPLRPG